MWRAGFITRRLARLESRPKSVAPDLVTKRGQKSAQVDCTDAAATSVACKWGKDLSILCLHDEADGAPCLHVLLTR
jgi:hypothetical protein